MIIWLSKNYQKKLFERQVQAKLDASSQVQEYLEGMKIIKSCNLSGSHFSALNKALLSMKKIAVKVEMICGCIYVECKHDFASRNWYCHFCWNNVVS